MFWFSTFTQGGRWEMVKPQCLEVFRRGRLLGSGGPAKGGGARGQVECRKLQI